MSSHSELESYLSYLQEVVESDLNSCDPLLLKSLLDLFDELTYNSVVESCSKKHLLVNLYVEDFEQKTGPFRIPCVPVWTGKTTKKKLFNYFRFPVHCQTLLVNSRLVKDDQSLFSMGLRQSSDVLCVFLKSTPAPQANEDDMQLLDDVFKSDVEEVNAGATVPPSTNLSSISSNNLVDRSSMPRTTSCSSSESPPNSGPSVSGHQHYNHAPS